MEYRLQGSGDKQGEGTCECDEGYSGELCNECGPRHFQSFSNATYTMCSREFQMTSFTRKFELGCQSAARADFNTLNLF